MNYSNHLLPETNIFNYFDLQHLSLVLGMYKRKHKQSFCQIHVTSLGRAKEVLFLNRKHFNRNSSIVANECNVI